MKLAFQNKRQKTSAQIFHASNIHSCFETNKGECRGGSNEQNATCKQSENDRVILFVLIYLIRNISMAFLFFFFVLHVESDAFRICCQPRLDFLTTKR